MGGRGASASTNVKSLFRDIKTQQKPDVRVRASNVKLDNKKNIIDFVKQQTNLDMSKYLEEKVSRSRTYLGVHLEDMNRNDRNEVIRLLRDKKGLRIGDNGGYGYAIYYKKK